MYIFWYIYTRNWKYIWKVYLHIIGVICIYICKHMPHELWNLGRTDVFSSLIDYQNHLIELFNNLSLTSPDCDSLSPEWHQHLCFQKAPWNNQSALLENRSGSLGTDKDEEGNKGVQTISFRSVSETPPRSVLVYVKPGEPILCESFYFILHKPIINSNNSCQKRASVNSACFETPTYLA